MDWVIGTVILWLLKAITIPLARAMAGENAPTPPSPTNPVPYTEVITLARLQPSSTAVNANTKEAEIPTETYILADVVVMGAAGLLIGGLTGYYLVGFSWRPKDWPGMVALIIASLLGAVFHG